MPNPLCHRTSLRPAIVLRLRLVVAALLTCGIAGPALAQTAITTNPGGSLFVSYHITESLSFSVPVRTTNTVSATVTEIIARLNGGAVLYDVFVTEAPGSFAAQAAVAAGNAALLTAGGAGTLLSGPLLQSQATMASSASSLLYSLDPSTPAVAPGNYVAGLPYVTKSSTTIFGPALAQGGIGGSPSTSLEPGYYSLCTVRTLPGPTAPTCSAFDGGTVSVPAGQTDVELDFVINYLIDTATTVTTTNTQTQVYEVDGTRAGVPTSVPEPAGWPLVVFGLAATGLIARRRDPRG